MVTRSRRQCWGDEVPRRKPPKRLDRKKTKRSRLGRGDYESHAEKKLWRRRNCRWTILVLVLLRKSFQAFFKLRRPPDFKSTEVAQTTFPQWQKRSKAQIKSRVWHLIQTGHWFAWIRVSIRKINLLTGWLRLIFEPCDDCALHLYYVLFKKLAIFHLTFVFLLVVCTLVTVVAKLIGSFRDCYWTLESTVRAQTSSKYPWIHTILICVHSEAASIQGGATWQSLNFSAFLPPPPQKSVLHGLFPTSPVNFIKINLELVEIYCSHTHKYTVTVTFLSSSYSNKVTFCYIYQKRQCIVLFIMHGISEMEKHQKSSHNVLLYLV